MKRRTFPCFMVDVELASNPKIGRFTPAQLSCLILGVWPMAAKADPRGHLVIAGTAATSKDVARHARCSEQVARGTLELMRELRMLEPADDGLERVHDWHDYNPDPSASNTKDAWRERKQAQRDRERHAKVTRDTPVTSREGHATEVKREREERGAAEAALSQGVRDRPGSGSEFASEATRLYAVRRGLILQSDPASKAAPAEPCRADLDDLCRLAEDRDGNVAEIEQVIRWALTDPCADAVFWRKRIPSVAKLREHFEQVRGAMTNQTSAPPRSVNAQDERMRARAARIVANAHEGDGRARVGSRPVLELLPEAGSSR